MKVLNYDSKIRKHEKNNDFETARELRTKALKVIPLSHQAPLLRSEGEDLLYRRKDYANALLTFEQALNVMSKSPALYGVSLPDNIYGGAARAALLCNDTEKATVYYQELNSLVQEYIKDKKLENSLQWHQETLKYLEHHLRQKMDNKPPSQRNTRPYFS